VPRGTFPTRSKNASNDYGTEGGKIANKTPKKKGSMLGKIRGTVASPV